MELKLKDFRSKLRQGADVLPPLLVVYGDDAGQVRALAREAAALVVPVLDDPFRVDRLGFDEIAQESQLLANTASILPFGDGKRLVLVDDGVLEGASATKGLLSALEAYLKMPSPHSVVIVSLPYTEKNSPLVRLVEKHPTAWGVRCYVAKEKFLKTDIVEFFSKTGKKVDPQALAFLMENLGNDAAITLSELTKLDIYTQGNILITLPDCLETLTSAPSVTIYKLCDAMGHRDADLCEQLMSDLLDDADEYPLLLATLYRHLKRLAECQYIARTEAVDYASAITQLRPPVAPFAVEDFLKQLQTLPAGRLQGLVDRFYQLQLQVRTLSGAEKTLIHRMVLSTIVN